MCGARYPAFCVAAAACAPLIPPHPAFLSCRFAQKVLDLDETLVHSSFKPVPGADYVIPVEIGACLPVALHSAHPASACVLQPLLPTLQHKPLHR